MWKATSFEAFVQKILQVRLHSDIDPMTDDCKVVFFFFVLFFCFSLHDFFYSHLPCLLHIWFLLLPFPAR